MAILGSVVIGLLAKTAGFDGPLKKSETAVKSFADKSKSLTALEAPLKKSEVAVQSFADKSKNTSAIVSKLTGVLVAAGTALSTVFAVGAGKAINEAADAAAKVGTTTEEFQKLQYALKLNQEGAHKLAPALATLLGNMQNAAIVSGPVRDAFNQLGLSTSELSSLDTGEAFKRIGDALSQIKDPATRARLAMLTLGDSAADMMKTLSSGTIGKSGDELAKLGGTVDALGQVNVANATKSFERIHAVGDAFGTMAATTLAPAIESIVNGFVDWVNQGDGVASKFQGVGKSLVEVADFITDVFTTAQTQIIKAINAILKSYVWVTNQLGIANDSVKVMIESLQDTIQERQNRVRKPFTDYLAESMKKASTEANKTAAAIKNVGAAAAVMNPAIKEGQALFDATRTPAERYKMELEKIQFLEKQGAIDSETARRARLKKAAESGLGETKFAGAMSRNSTEARSTILQANARDRLTAGDVGKSTAATAAYTRDSSVSLRTLVTMAGRQQEAALSLQ